MKYLPLLAAAVAISFSCSEQETDKLESAAISGSKHPLALDNITLPDRVLNDDDNETANYLAGYVFFTNIAIDEARESLSETHSGPENMSRSVLQTEAGHELQYESLYKTAADDFYKRSTLASVAKDGASGKVQLYFPATAGERPDVLGNLQWSREGENLHLTHRVDDVTLSYVFNESVKTWDLTVNSDQGKTFEFQWKADGTGAYKEFDKAGRTLIAGKWL